MNKEFILNSFSDLDPNEYRMIQGIFVDLSEKAAQQFSLSYKAERKETLTTLMCVLIGIGGIAGIQRFYLKQEAMGVFFLLTCGFAGIGTLIDLINHKEMTWKFNTDLAQRLSFELKVLYP